MSAFFLGGIVAERGGGGGLGVASGEAFFFVRGIYFLEETCILVCAGRVGIIGPK